MMNEYDYRDDYNGAVPIDGCTAALQDGKLSVRDTGGWGEFYLDLDEQNTGKLRGLIGGSIKKNLKEYFSSSSAIFLIREYCDGVGIEYHWNSWTSGDDWDDLYDD